MSEWKKCAIGDMVMLRQGFAINAKSKHYISKVPTSLALLRIADMKSGSREIYVKEDIPRNFIAQPQDIVYTRTGNVGLVFRNNYGVVHNNCFTVTPNDERALSRDFLFYLLQSKYFFEKANSLARGAAQPDLPHSLFNSIEISYPDLDCQQRIADILSNYDSLIENYQKQIKLLEEAAQRLYKEWFVDLRFPGHENTKIVDGVPEGWEKKKLEDIFSYVRGRSYTSKELSDSGTILVNLKNIQAFGGYKRDAEKRYLGDYKQEQSLEVGDLIMGVTDMTQERRLVGHVALIPDFDEPATFSMDLIKILPFELSKSFLYCAMRFGGISKQISPLANGVNVLHLKPEAMMGIEMVVPSKELVNHFDDYIKNNFNTILYLQNQIRYLTEARDRLLPKLMSGEITV